MGFDLAKFEAARLEDRTEVVSVPELKEFFDDPSKSDWTVKALDAIELAEAREAKQRNRSLETLITGLMSTQSEDKAQAIKETLGISNEVAPDDYVWRVAVLRLGSVDPKLDEGQAVRIGKAHSVVFQKLTNKIVELSGQGMKLGE